MNKKIIATLIGLFCSTIVFSQTPSFRCNFSNGQITKFENNLPNTKKENGFVELIFDKVDTSKKTARLIGNAGVETVQAIDGDESIHLIEFTASGNMNITTIFISEKFKRTGFFPVVHSRHVKIASSPLPSQYIGTCKELLQ
jgi:hypothetical protein